MAYGAAFFAGRHIGAWLGEVAQRPRIVTIPVIAGFTFVLITFVFHVIMTNIRDAHKEKEEKDEFHLPWTSCLSGAAINLCVGLFSAVFLFWLGDLFMVGTTGGSIPGASKSKFAAAARSAVYETAYGIGSRAGEETQAAAAARMISDPATGMRHLENVIAADSVQQLIRDKEFGKCLMSGDAERIENNPSLQALFADKETLNELKQLGVFAGDETKQEMCQNLSKIGGNETIQASMESLRARGLISTDKITLLIRDPEFDVIIGELLK